MFVFFFSTFIVDTSQHLRYFEESFLSALYSPRNFGHIQLKPFGCKKINCHKYYYGIGHGQIYTIIKVTKLDKIFKDNLIQYALVCHLLTR